MMMRVPIRKRTEGKCFVEISLLFVKENVFPAALVIFY
jgi:hypothetical protein